jgi:hypothetical protein
LAKDNGGDEAFVVEIQQMLTDMKQKVIILFIKNYI